MTEEHDFLQQQLMAAFNNACQDAVAILSDLTQSSAYIDPDNSEYMFIDLPIGIDNDDWWMFSNKMGGYLEQRYKILATEKKNNPEYYEELRADEIQDFKRDYPKLFGHFNAMNQTAEDKEARFIPHEVEYAYPDFIRLDGFRQLNELCQTMGGTGLKVMLDVNDKAQSLLEGDSYRFVLVFQATDGQPMYNKLENIPKVPGRKLN